MKLMLAILLIAGLKLSWWWVLPTAVMAFLSHCYHEGKAARIAETSLEAQLGKPNGKLVMLS